ncbi:MAG: phosphoenolpyruvate kinase [Myxococcota bacterium]
MALLDEAADELASLDRALEARAGSNPAIVELPPMHTVLCPADRFGPDTFTQFGITAWESMVGHGPDPHSFAMALGVYQPGQLPRSSVQAMQARRFREDPQALRHEDFDAWLVHAVHARVQQRLESRPVEDLRIDFEGGYGTRDDAEEDRHAKGAAESIADATERGVVSPRLGLRIKPLSRRAVGRAVRTLEVFIDTLSGCLQRQPTELVLTLPQVSLPEQVSTAAHLLSVLEQRHRWAPGLVRMELLVETTPALFDEAGRCALPRLVGAAEGRCVAVHLGSEDLARACGLAPELADGEHPLSDLARGLLRLALGRTEVTLSDSITGPLPEGPHPLSGPLSAAQRSDNLAAVHRAWRRGHAQILHALRQGFYHGWDRHGAEIPVRCAANYRFFLLRFDEAATQLRELLTHATSAVVPDQHGSSTRHGQRLLDFVRRAHRCGAIGQVELERVGLEPAELDQPRFVELVAHRRARALEGSEAHGRL